MLKPGPQHSIRNLAPRTRSSDRTRILSNPVFWQTYIMLLAANLSLVLVKLESRPPTFILPAGKDTGMQSYVRLELIVLDFCAHSISLLPSYADTKWQENPLCRAQLLRLDGLTTILANGSLQVTSLCLSQLAFAGSESPRTCMSKCYTQSPYPKRMYPDHLQAVIHNAGSESSEAGIGSHRSLVWYESPTLAVQYLDHPRLRHFLQ